MNSQGLIRTSVHIPSVWETVENWVRVEVTHEIHNCFTMLSTVVLKLWYIWTLDNQYRKFLNSLQQVVRGSMAVRADTTSEHGRRTSFFGDWWGHCFAGVTRRKTGIVQIQYNTPRYLWWLSYDGTLSGNVWDWCPLTYLMIGAFYHSMDTYQCQHALN